MIRSRRALLKQAAVLGMAFPSLPVDWLQSQAEDEVIPFTDIPDNFSTRRGTDPDPNPGQNTYRLDWRKKQSWITPVEEFFAVGHYGYPRVDAATWRLRCDGMVGRKIELTLDQIKKRPRVEHTLVFECSGNRDRSLHGMVGNARWAGCKLTDVLKELQPTREAREAVFWAADTGKEEIRGKEYMQNFGRSMSLQEAMDSDAILAYEMNGQPLPVVHGFPVRLIVPGWYGIANVKWLERIELSPRRLMNRFMGRDYVTLMGRKVGDREEWVETSVGRARVKSMIVRLTRSRGAGGRLKVFGVAWGGDEPLERVELSVDGGAWRAVRLEAQPQSAAFAWTFWSQEIDALPDGAHTVAARATNRGGHLQPESLDEKKTYWEDNAIFRRPFKLG
jgi:DMSO/TMAO reductase YedYZ molybdopterin-dependent catalytic subunit